METQESGMIPSHEMRKGVDTEFSIKLHSKRAHDLKLESYNSKVHKERYIIKYNLTHLVLSLCNLLSRSGSG